jgi:hypothetical protein
MMIFVLFFIKKLIFDSKIYYFLLEKAFLELPIF